MQKVWLYLKVVGFAPGHTVFSVKRGKQAEKLYLQL
jgi:hypothetical protein